MSSAAQKDGMLEGLSYAATGTEHASGLKQIVSERLEAHRRRRAEGVGSGFAQEADQAPAPRHASKVRDAVAARYQNSVTYREFLAQEAERASQRAHAEAEIAARNARAVADEQMRLLEELQQWAQAPGPREIALVEHQAEMRETRAHARVEIAVAATERVEQQTLLEMVAIEEPVVRHAPSSDRSTSTTASTEVGSAGMTVRLYEDLIASRSPAEGARRMVSPIEADERESSALDDEIAFRRAPEFEQNIPHVVGIPGNLIEFPRQLVATRKARPRLAEGPLREEGESQPQLRIFEVEPEQISDAPAEAASAPEWQSILLEGAPQPQPLPRVEEQFHYTMQPQTARLELRLMAAAVDGCCVGTALLGFAAVVAQLAGPNLRALPLPMMGAAAAVVAVVFFVMYQLLFFTLGEATPGMRYARIALCTFADSNPTRSAMRRRVFAILLAACPLGLGLAWAWMDDDSLGWHDRISRMYQRSY